MYREKSKARLQQKRHDYYQENKDKIKNMLDNGNKTIPSWCGCKNKNTFKKNKDKINECRCRKHAERKEAKNISV